MTVPQYDTEEDSADNTTALPETGRAISIWSQSIVVVKGDPAFPPWLIAHIISSCDGVAYVKSKYVFVLELSAPAAFGACVPVISVDSAVCVSVMLKTYSF
jgi:hypothetical protein